MLIFLLEMEFKDAKFLLALKELLHSNIASIFLSILIKCSRTYLEHTREGGGIATSPRSMFIFETGWWGKVVCKAKGRENTLCGRVLCNEYMKLQYKGSKRKIAFRVTGSPSRRRKTK